MVAIWGDVHAYLSGGALPLRMRLSGAMLLGPLSWSGITSFIAFGGIAGAALLFTFILLGRPPISPPTLTGVSVFCALVTLWLWCVAVETWVLARLFRHTQSEMRFVVLGGYVPLVLAWPLVAVLYQPEVHHWFTFVDSVKPAMVLTIALPTLALKAAAILFLARHCTVDWAWRYRFVLAGLGYAAAALAAKPSLWHLDLAGWFVPAARLVLAGRPLEMYSVRADVMGTASPLEHGPLTVLFYVPFVALAEVAGSTDFLRLGALFPLLGILSIDCLMAYQVTRAIHDIAPDVSDSQLFGIAVLILFSPLLWFSSVWLVHLESLNALLVIGAVRLLGRQRGLPAGLCLGAAMLLKHSAALAAGPLLLALFLVGSRGLAMRTGTTAAAVTLLGLLPFALGGADDFHFNFAGYDSIKPIYGLTIWKAAYDSGIEPLIMRLDSVLIATLALANAAGAALFLRTRGADPRCVCWIAVVLGQIAWLGLATWQYPHYFVLGFVALLIWESATVKSNMPVLSLLFLFVPYNLQSHFPSNVGKAGGAFVVARATAQLLFLYGCAVTIWLRAARTPQPLAQLPVFPTPSAPHGAPLRHLA